MSATVVNEPVRVQAGECRLDAALWLPEDSLGLVLFAYGGSSSRLIPPNDYVASILHTARLATLWVDLLLPDEARSHAARTDVGLLSDRLRAVRDWVRGDARVDSLDVGIFAAHHSAAAALRLAADDGDGLSAVVARSGQLGLLDHHILLEVEVPTMLIVGELDEPLLRANRQAFAALRCEKRLDIVPGATHTFEEPGNQEVAARRARSWFLQHLCSTAPLRR